MWGTRLRGGSLSSLCEMGSRPGDCGDPQWSELTWLGPPQTRPGKRCTSGQRIGFLQVPKSLCAHTCPAESPLCRVLALMWTSPAHPQLPSPPGALTQGTWGRPLPAGLNETSHSPVVTSPEWGSREWGLGGRRGWSWGSYCHGLSFAPSPDVPAEHTGEAQTGCVHSRGAGKGLCVAPGTTPGARPYAAPFQLRSHEVDAPFHR